MELRDPDVSEERGASRRARTPTALSPARRALHLRTPSRRLSMDHSRFRPTIAPPWTRAPCACTRRKSGSSVASRLCLSRAAARLGLLREAPPITSTLSSVRSHARARERVTCVIYICMYLYVGEAGGGTEFSLERGVRSRDEALAV